MQNTAKNMLNLVIILGCMLLNALPCNAQNAANDGAFLQGLSSLVKDKLLPKFEKKTFPIQYKDLFNGTLSFPEDATKKTSLSINHIELTNDQAITDLSIQIPAVIRGKVSDGAQQADIELTGELMLECSGSVALKRLEGEIVLVPKLDGLKVRVKLLSDKPAGVVRDLRELEKFINSALALGEKEALKNAQTALSGNDRIAIAVAGDVTAGKNALLRLLIATALKKELSKHNSRESSWVTKSKARIIVATVPIEFRVWLIEPQRQLTVTINKLELRDEVVYFQSEATGDMQLRAEGPLDITPSGKASARIEIEGQLGLSSRGRTENVHITKFVGTLTKVAVKDIPDFLNGPIKDLANGFLKDKNDELRRSLENEMNGIGF